VPRAFAIHHHLHPFPIGRDPLAAELLADQMLRLDRDGRSGMYLTGVSPVDCALWDLKGTVSCPGVRVAGDRIAARRSSTPLLLLSKFGRPS
jgi:L-alanine-DL-glutamate epimerase-like enolase superfamily enzyme